MLLDNINNVLKRQYDELKRKQDYGGKIEVNTQVKTDTIKGYTIDQYAARTYNLTCGYPMQITVLRSATLSRSITALVIQLLISLLRGLK